MANEDNEYRMTLAELKKSREQAAAILEKLGFRNKDHVMGALKRNSCFKEER